MNERLEQIQKRVEEATPGPWKPYCRHVDNLGNDPSFPESGGLGWEVEGPPEPQLRGQFSSGWDAHFIAHARDDIPYLLGQLAGVQAENARLREFAEYVLESCGRDSVDDPLVDAANAAIAPPELLEAHKVGIEALDKGEYITLKDLEDQV